jgi:hypothetical protein
MRNLLGFEELPGRRARAIAYELLPWDKLPVPRGDIDFVSTAVRLYFDDSTVARFHWLQGPAGESLAVGPWQPGEPIPGAREVDVSDRWSVIAATLVGYTRSLHKVDYASSPAPWACRLNFDTDTHLVIALGERAPDGGVSYIPDSLIVTDSRVRAIAYRPPDTSASAWGNEG